jgi:uncharacterized repeat protein (TIGR01451 family)
LDIGDVNGDGHPDVVVGCEAGNQVSVLLGTSGGAFTVSYYAAGGQVSDIALGDANGDGRLDVAAALRDSAQVGVLLGAGDGTFATPQRYQVGEDASGLALADVDGDGHLDVVTTNRVGESVSVLRGTGDGRFGHRLDYGAGQWPVRVASGDFDGDGDEDLAATDVYNDSVWLLWNSVAPSPVVAKGDLIDPIRAGNNEYYFITVSNPRWVPITQVMLTDTLPPGLDFVSADYDGVGQWGNPIVTWDLGTMGPEEEITIRLTAHTRSSLSGGTVITNTVVLDCAECRLTSAFAETTIEYPPTPTPTQTATPGPTATRVPAPYGVYLPLIWAEQ